MTTRTPPKGTKAKTPKRLAVDDEARALIANPVFRAMLQEAKNTPPGDYIPLEELERRLGPVPAEDAAVVQDYIAALDRLEAEQGAEVTDTQAALLKTILVAARHVRGERTLAAWVEYTGIPPEQLRAAALALRAARLVETPAAQ